MTKTEDLELLTWDENILLAGMMAKIYAESDYNSPIQNWAWAVPTTELPVGNRIYRLGPGRQVIDGLEQNGVQMTVIEADGSKTHFFVPCTQLRQATLQVRGMRI